jgi:hypothetical protein
MERTISNGKVGKMVSLPLLKNHFCRVSHEYYFGSFDWVGSTSQVTETDL